MTSYPDRYQKDDFTTHVSITHDPTQFKFLQRASKIIVLSQDYESGRWMEFAEFTTTELQIAGTYLTEAALRRAAITWLKDHLK